MVTDSHDHRNATAQEAWRGKSDNTTPSMKRIRSDSDLTSINAPRLPIYNNQRAFLQGHSAHDPQRLPDAHGTAEKRRMPLQDPKLHNPLWTVRGTGTGAKLRVRKRPWS
jgi:hypothetical protein